VPPLDGTMKKSEEFVVREPGTMESACRRGVEGRRDWESDRLWRKEC
jgi:hypothetical protein